MNAELVQKLKVPPPQRDPNEFTIKEYMAAVGVGRTAAKDRLNKLIEQGVIVAKKVTVTNAAGVTTTTWGYRYVGDKDGNG